MQILILNINQFGTRYVQGIHQVLESERDVIEAMETAEKDGYSRIYFYVRFPAGWMLNHDFQSLLRTAREVAHVST